MKSLPLVFVFSLMAITASAQLPEEPGHPGFVELRSGEQLEGSISYYTDSKIALLQLQQGRRVLSFDASQIALFSFFDQETGMNRVFYSLPFRPEGVDYEVTLFFESLVEGKHLLVLNRIEYRNETRKVEDSDLYKQIALGRQRGSGQSTSGVEAPIAGVLSHDDGSTVLRKDGKNGRQTTVAVPYETLFLVVPNTLMEAYNEEPTSLDTRVIQYRKPNSELLFRLMGDKRQQVEEYIAVNKLDVRKRSDLLSIVYCYNELKAREEKVK